MSTRCPVLVTDEYSEPRGSGCLFYRHSDGYPEGVRDSLRDFLQLVKDGKIRNNAGQSAGWLVIVGHHEYGPQEPEAYAGQNRSASTWPPTNWKVGAYEPASGLHGDTEYFYIVNVSNQTVRYFDSFDPDKWELADFCKREAKPLDVFADVKTA